LPLFLSFASTVPQKETEQAGTVCPYGDIMVNSKTVSLLPVPTLGMELVVLWLIVKLP